MQIYFQTKIPINWKIEESQNKAKLITTEKRLFENGALKEVRFGCIDKCQY